VIDAAWTGASGWRLYEVLGTGGHTYARMRDGAARLKDIEYAEGVRVERAFLVLPQEPEEPWTVEGVRERHQISVIWRTPTGWAGPDVPAAFGQESG
jgi:hypothetical protein